MNSIQQIIIGTPWWVYALFIYLIWIGIIASKTRVVSLKKLFIVPIIFGFISIHTLVTSFQMSALTITTWSGAIVLGTLLGWIQIHRYTLKIDKIHHLVQVPGTWSTLIFILIIFATKYYFGYELAVDPKLAEQSLFEFSMLAISGVFTGLFIGRLICYLYRFKTNPSVDLLKE